MATVGIGKAGAKNAALLTVQILALTDVKLREKLHNYRQRMTEGVLAKDAKLRRK